MGFSSLSRDQTQASCSESVESTTGPPVKSLGGCYSIFFQSQITNFISRHTSQLIWKNKEVTIRKCGFIFTCFWMCWVLVAVCQHSLVAVSVAYSLVAAIGLLTVVASPVGEHRL